MSCGHRHGEILRAGHRRPQEWVGLSGWDLGSGVGADDSIEQTLHVQPMIIPMTCHLWTYRHRHKALTEQWYCASHLMRCRRLCQIQMAPGERRRLRRKEGRVGAGGQPHGGLCLDGQQSLTGLPPQMNSTSSATSSASAPPVAALRTTFTPLTWGARVPSANLRKLNSSSACKTRPRQCSALMPHVAARSDLHLVALGRPRAQRKSAPPS